MAPVDVLCVGQDDQMVAWSRSIRCCIPVPGFDSSTVVVGTEVPVATVDCSVSCCLVVGCTSWSCSFGTLLSSAQQVCPHSLDTDRSAARPWVVGCIVVVGVHKFDYNFVSGRMVLAGGAGAAAGGGHHNGALAASGRERAHLTIASSFVCSDPLILLELAWDHACLTSAEKKRWVSTRANGRLGLSKGNVSSSVVWSVRAGKNFVGVLARRVSSSSWERGIPPIARQPESIINV